MADFGPEKLDLLLFLIFFKFNFLLNFSKLIDEFLLFFLLAEKFYFFALISAGNIDISLTFFSLTSTLSDYLLFSEHKTQVKESPR